MELAWTVEEYNDATLVSLQITNDGPRRRVRVHNRLDGPVWYPRQDGQPAAGWSEAGFEGAVPAGGRRPLGYACPAPAGDPPAEIVAVGVDDRSGVTAADAVRRLGDPRPPRDAVPASDHRDR